MYILKSMNEELPYIMRISWLTHPKVAELATSFVELSSTPLILPQYHNHAN